jgi:hypothetical protein
MSSTHLTSSTDLTTGGTPVAHPVMRATAMSSIIGLVAGLVLGLVTQAREHDAG